MREERERERLVLKSLGYEMDKRLPLSVEEGGFRRQNTEPACEIPPTTQVIAGE